MKYSGTIEKMKGQLDNDQSVLYQFRLRDRQKHQLIDLSELVGKEISLTHTGDIYCTQCGRKTKKSYGQGHCGECFKTLPQCDMCLVKPENCHFHLGTCRGEKWAKTHCFRPHYIYLANSSGIKVGITRNTQIPTRWIDQGARQATIVFEVKDRKTAGEVEVQLSQVLPDRTNWRQLLKGESEEVDFDQIRQKISSVEDFEKRDGVEKYPDSKVWQLKYPVHQYPEKIVSLNFDKNPVVEGVLQGIKGQYLMLDSGVINVRKFTGYEIELNTAP